MGAISRFNNQRANKCSQIESGDGGYRTEGKLE
jgi:hypothetical protein